MNNNMQEENQEDDDLLLQGGSRSDNNKDSIPTAEKNNNNKSGGGEKNGGTTDDDDIDDAELARMMAFQEEEEATTTQTAAAVAAVVEEGDNNNIEYDPNIAYIGNNNDDDDEGDDIPNNNPPPNNNNNNNNPAAIALRQRQALQNQHHRNQIEAFNNQPYITRQLIKLFRPLCRYTPLSLLVATLLFHHTIRTRQQFYLTVVYIQSSKLSYIIFGNAIIACAVSIFTLVTRLFLDGGLRLNERDAIGENIRWDVTETCLALTIFRSELDVVTAVMFLGLVVMKCLHWSAELRGSHLRMTEEVLVYPEEDDAAAAADNNSNNATSNTQMKRWYQRLPHLRMTHVSYYIFLNLLLAVDIAAVAHAALSVATDGPSVQILFGFEFAIMLISASSAIMSYNLHVIDGLMGFLHHWAEGEHHHCPVSGMAEPDANEVDESNNTGPSQEEEIGSNDAAVAATDNNNDETNAAAGQTQQQPPPRSKSFAGVLLKHLANPWRDQRATFTFVIELQAQAAKFLFYVVFFAIVFTYYGMPINIFREVYVSFQQLRRRLIAFNNYRRLTNNMEKRFESVTDEEELDRLGHTCIICRDQMDLLGGCKKLPGCGHAFHTHCLREWLVQQQTCPTCRADIAANEARMKKEKEKEAAAAAAMATTEGAPSANAAATTTTTTTTTSSEATEGQGSANGTAPTEPQTKGNEQITSLQSNAVTQELDLSNDLPSGWTEHTDLNSGKKYYHNKELNKSTWERPKKKKSLAFPCLYRVTSPAKVFSADSIAEIGEKLAYKRVIPVGKIIVCTSEVDPELNIRLERYRDRGYIPFFRIPDGYVMGCDVEKMFELSNK